MKLTQLMEQSFALMEDEMDRAQLILAAKAVLDQLQDMAEKLAKTEAEGIMPLLDGIRLQFGPEFAERLSNDSAAALRAALESVKTCKDTISQNISNMQQIVTGTGPGNDMSSNIGVPQEEPAAPEQTVAPDAATGNEPQAPAEPASDEDLEDVFGADAETPVGRDTKESVQARNINMLRESANPDRLLMTNVMSRMKHGQTGAQAIRETARSFGVDVEDVLDIVKQFTK